MTRALRVWFLLAAVGLGVLAPGAAASAADPRIPPTPSPGANPTADPGPSGPVGSPGHQYSLDIQGGSAGFIYIICLTTTTTINKYPLGKERACSGRKGSTHGTFTMTIEYNEGDTLWIDFEHITGVGSTTDDDLRITGAKYCKITGTVHNAKIHCPDATGVENIYSLPPILPYSAESTSVPVMQLLNLMAWCVSAAAVLGLLVTGTNLALQVRRGITGELGEYTRALPIIAGACLIGTTAGPVIQVLGIVN